MKKLMTLLLVLLINTSLWADGSSFAAAMLLGKTDQHPDRFATDDSRYSEERSTTDNRYAVERSGEDRRYSEERTSEELSPEMSRYYRCLDHYYDAKGQYFTLKIAVEQVEAIEKEKDEPYNRGLGTSAIVAGAGGITYAAGRAGNSDFAQGLGAVGIVGGIIGIIGNFAAKGANNENWNVAALGLYDMSLRELKKELKQYEEPEVPEGCRTNATWDMKTFTDESNSCKEVEVENKTTGRWDWRIVCTAPAGDDCEDCRY